MKGYLLKNLSANTLQLVINQAFGFVIFFILSTGLDKGTFGQINLSLAFLLAVFNILSFGIDQIIVQKIAAGADAASLLSVCLFHVVLSGGFFYAVLLVANFLLPHLFAANQLLLFIAIGKLMVFFSTPFKQLAAGMEQFKLVCKMSVVSNIVRGLCLLVFAFSHMLNLNCVIIVFIAGDMAELLFSIFLFRHKFDIPIRLNGAHKQYLALISQSLPQIGVVIFTSALARFDWIFIGLMVSAVKLAEYSFAYKIFEISTLPLLALAPLLVPRFTQILKNKDLPIDDVKVLLRAEMLIATFISLVLYLCWSPLIDGVTAGKYGAVNSTTVLILSLCTPLLYLNNFLWSVSFARGQLKMIFRVIAITFVVNLLGDVLLIPFFHNEGAAIAYLLAMLAQCIAYFKASDVEGLVVAWFPLLVCTLCAILAGFIAQYTFTNNVAVLVTAIAIYSTGLLLTKQFRLSDWRNIAHIFG